MQYQQTQQEIQKSWNIEKLLQTRTDEIYKIASFKDIMLYAISVGYGKNSQCPKELQFTYELAKNFQVLPTYECVLVNANLISVLQQCPYVPKFDAMKLLHGEQHLELFKKFNPDATYVSSGRFVDVVDKGKATLISFEYETYEVNQQDKSRQLVAKCSVVYFIRGLTGANFKGTNYTDKILSQPKTEPTITVDYKTSEDQAIIYRLNGDYNPLHIDPEEAKRVGFEKPILHGLCFYGIGCKVIVDKICNGEASRIKKYNCRFVSSVIPGDELEVRLWVKNEQSLDIGIFNKNTQKYALQGQVELHPVAKL